MKQFTRYTGLALYREKYRSVENGGGNPLVSTAILRWYQARRRWLLWLIPLALLCATGGLAWLAAFSDTNINTPYRSVTLGDGTILSVRSGNGEVAWLALFFVSILGAGVMLGTAIWSAIRIADSLASSVRLVPSSDFVWSPLLWEGKQPTHFSLPPEATPVATPSLVAQEDAATFRSGNLGAVTIRPEPLEGFKYLLVGTDGFLYSEWNQTRWTPGIMRAECARSAHHVDVPRVDCTCGLYVYKPRIDSVDSVSDVPSNGVWVKVRLGGRVIEYENVYRAEEAEIIEILGPCECAHCNARRAVADVRRKYGLPSGGL